MAKLVGHLGDGKDGADNSDIKLHTHFELLKGVPAEMDLTQAADSEVENLLKNLLPDRVYVKDRGYACFRLFQKIIDIGSHFVCRVRSYHEAEKTGRVIRAAVRLRDVPGLMLRRGQIRHSLHLRPAAFSPHPDPKWTDISPRHLFQQVPGRTGLGRP